MTTPRRARLGGKTASYNRLMCYSALVRQDLRSLGRRYGADIDWKWFETLFGMRLRDPHIKIARALEANFEVPQSPVEERIKSHVDAFRLEQASAWEQELFKQKKRLADAQRSLRTKQTKRATEDERIATSRIEQLVGKLHDLRRTTVEESDSRIFPLYYAPVIVAEGGRRLIRPMRYTCRLAGKPANYDTRFPGTYNARRDSLTGFWTPLYGTHHAVMVVSSFYENVPHHLYEKRELATDEKPRNRVLQFKPSPPADMIVACLWSHWAGKDAPDLYSFAAITDDPPPEIAATGHNRCIIALREANLAAWLSPHSLHAEQLERILSERECPYYEHQIAA